MPHLVGPFLDEVDNPYVTDDVLFTGRPPGMTSIDAKLFSALVHLLVTKPCDDSTRILGAIRQLCQPGCGRQALRLIDGDYVFKVQDGGSWH